MNWKTILLVIAFLGISLAIWLGEQNMNHIEIKKEIRTYRLFSYPLDPATINTTSDLELSYALASTLVSWDANRQPSAGLASEWKEISPGKYSFTLRDRLAWSDGNELTSHDIKNSFERKRKTHGEDLKALFSLLKEISTPSDSEIVFHTDGELSMNAFAIRLTEPMYGVTKAVSEDKIDLSVTTGPFFVASADENELSLRRNPHWYNYTTETAIIVTIKQGRYELDQITAESGITWPNMINSNSLLSDSLKELVESKGFRFWNRNQDRVFLMALGKRLHNESGYRLLRAIGRNLERRVLLKGKSGYVLGNQIFPKGYELYSENVHCELPEEEFHAPQSIKILIPEDRVSTGLADGIRDSIQTTMGVNVDLEAIPSSSIPLRLAKGDFDILASSLAISSRNYDGSLSFMFEREIPVIPSGSGKNAFLERLKRTRLEKNHSKRIEDLKNILDDAVCEGHVLPLFHFSNVVASSKDIDLSLSSSTDETVNFSKVRFK